MRGRREKGKEWGEAARAHAHAHTLTRTPPLPQAMDDPAKRARIEKFVMLLRAVLEARKRLMVTFNAPADKLESILTRLPA